MSTGNMLADLSSVNGYHEGLPMVLAHIATYAVLALPPTVDARHHSRRGQEDLVFLWRHESGHFHQWGCCHHRPAVSHGSMGIITRLCFMSFFTSSHHGPGSIKLNRADGCCGGCDDGSSTMALGVHWEVCSPVWHSLW
uniref:Uncharacterized protein n=1 Tax=Oryza barthii TaxID=65489 RepID=A0A0D3FAH6_9ORYZ